MSDLRAPPNRLLDALTYLGWAYPVLFLLGLYGLWLFAWITLGHAPIPSQDDPQYISIPVRVAYVAVALAMTAGPFVALWSIVATIWFAVRRQLGVVWTLGLLFVVVDLWVGMIALLRWDPCRVGYWFMD